MALRLTPELLEGAYEYLRACSPFCQWKLPHADDLEFCVTRHKDRFGHFRFEEGRKWPQIAVSQQVVGSHVDLLLTLGHELVHMKEFVEGATWGKNDHGLTFMRHARKVCKANNWALEDFL